MADINRSVQTIRTELQFLQERGLLNSNQSIVAQLPNNGQPSQYTDYGDDHPGQKQQQQDYQPQMNHSYSAPPGYAEIAQQAQNPNNAAHPDNPRHNEWLKKMGSKFGNAAVWGAGATFGGELVHDAMSKVGL